MSMVLWLVMGSVLLGYGNQGPDWTPPKTTLPSEFVEATRFCLAHGMADPRGGEFVQAKVPSLNAAWGGNEPSAIYGWLMPDGKLVAIDGLTYAPVSKPTPASLDDVIGTKQATSPMIWNDRPPTFAAMLLLTGQPRYAERLVTPTENRTPFVTLSSSYLSKRFLRAVAAHMHGDDDLALSDANELLRVRNDFEAEAKKTLGPDWLARYGSPEQAQMGGPTAYLFLRPVKLLADDSERRLKEGKKTKLDPATLAGLPQNERISKLIDALDEVDARQWGQPGGVTLASDSIVAALIKEGPAAGEPILDCIEHDKRLTRSVSFGRDFFPERNLITVRDAAYAAFRCLVDVQTLGQGGEQLTVQGLRDLWRKYGSLPPDERWMKTLEDDQAGEGRWAEATGRIVEGSNVTHLDGMSTMTSKPKPGEVVAMKGETLRHRTNPSVSELISKRAIQISGAGDHSSSTHAFQLSTALQMALSLAKWSPKEALPTLQVVSRRTLELVKLNSTIPDLAGSTLSEVIVKRVELGDKSALSEYAEAAIGSQEISGGQGQARFLVPLVKYADNPLMRKTADQMFLGDTNWNLVKMSKSMPGWNHVETLIFTPILQLPSVQKSVFSILTDKTEIGKSWVANDVVMWSNSSGSSGSGGHKPDGFEPPAGEKRPFRICDNMAMTLARLKGAPAFQPYWPIEKKDQAIEGLAAYVKAHLKEITKLIGWPNDWSRPPYE